MGRKMLEIKSLHGLSLLTRYVEDKYGKTYSDTWLRQTSKSLDFTYKRGVYKPTLANPELQESFKKMSELLDIIEPVEDISLWAMDETGKRLESNNFYSWSPKGKPTIIEHNGNHKGLNIIGATEVLHHFDFVYTAYSKDDGALTVRGKMILQSHGKENFLCTVSTFFKGR